MSDVIRTVLVLVCLGLAPMAVAAERVALVIGNAKYVKVGALTNPPNDAADMAAAFRKLGFQVTLALDLDYAGMRKALAAFQTRAIGAKQAVIYYAGHGIEVDKVNYLIPVDAKLQTDRAVEFETLQLDLLVLAADGATDLSLVILDACRDNPFARSITRTTRSIGRGLAAYEPEGNTVVAYAAKEGTFALDGNGRNSPYATALLEAMAQPGLEIGKFFRVVRDRVLELTNGAQEPFVYSSLSGRDYFLSPPVPAGLTPPPLPPDAAKGQGGGPDASREIAFWNAIAASQDRRDFEEYLRRFPQGTFSGLAQRRLAALGKGPAAPPPEARGRPKPSDAAAFVERALQVWSADNRHAFREINDYYARQVEFYGQSRTRDEVIQIKRDYARLWPVRNYSVDLYQGETRCNADGVCSVRAELVWFLRNEGTGQSDWGSGLLALDLIADGDSFRITRESVTAR